MNLLAQVPTTPQSPLPGSTMPVTSQQAPPSVDELMSGLRPLKPPVDIPAPPEVFPYAWVVWGGVGAVALALLSWGIWKWFRRKNSLTPEQRALLSLGELNQGELGNDAFVMKVSHVLKGFFEEQNLFAAVRQTTEEFLSSLKNNDKLNAHRDTLKKFFEQCDLVKFAGGNLADEQRKELIDSACALVRGIARPEPRKSQP